MKNTAIISIIVVIVLAIIALIIVNVSIKNTPVDINNTKNDTNITTGYQDAIATFETYGGLTSPEINRQMIRIEKDNIYYEIRSADGSLTYSTNDASDNTLYPALVQKMSEINFLDIGNQTPSTEVTDAGQAKLTLITRGRMNAIFISPYYLDGGVDSGVRDTVRLIEPYMSRFFGDYEISINIPPHNNTNNTNTTNSTGGGGGGGGNGNETANVTLTQFAENWIQNEPTYKYDGYDLKLVSNFQGSGPIERDFLTYTFTSKSTGYGNRGDQASGQTVTTHTIVLVIQNMNAQYSVTSAIIDNVWDELNQRMVNTADPYKKTVLEYLPLQCTDTPWEKYAAMLARPIQPTDRQMIELYYGSKNITILDFDKIAPENGGTTGKCGDSRGYTFRVTVFAQDMNVLLDDGWKTV